LLRSTKWSENERIVSLTPTKRWVENKNFAKSAEKQSFSQKNTFKNYKDHFPDFGNMIKKQNKVKIKFLNGCLKTKFYLK
jgi:uncharacterized membrane protein